MAISAAGCSSLDVDGTLVVDAPAPVGTDVLRSVARDMALGQGVTVGAFDGTQHAWVEAGSSGKLALEVTPAARSLVVELVETSGAGRLLLHAIPPSAGETTPLLVDRDTLYASQDETGRAFLVVDDPQPGTWSFDAHADGLASGMRFTIYATTLAAVAPTGFTAIPG